MRVHVLQHVPFEGIGSMAGILDARGISPSTTPLYAGPDPDFPPMEEVDLLIAMGGPMSVNDEARHPWLPLEKEFIAQAVRSRKPLLGVCLGAQLIAVALGARVYPNQEKEIGWYPVTATVPGLDVFPERMVAFHWHGETFDLPPGSVLLASSEGCVNQAFRFGDRVFGLQFHLETTPESACALVENCRGELTPSPFVQSAEAILETDGGHYAGANAVMVSLLDRLLRLADSRD